MNMLKSTITSALATAALILPNIGSFAADNAMAEKFSADRLAFFGKGDAAAILNQYASDATVITPQGVLHGRDQIKTMIDGIIAEFAQPNVKFQLLTQNAEGPIVSFSWTAQTVKNDYALGVETYVLKDGLAEFQTFAAKVTPR